MVFGKNSVINGWKWSSLLFKGVFLPGNGVVGFQPRGQLFRCAERKPTYPFVEAFTLRSRRTQSFSTAQLFRMKMALICTKISTAKRTVRIVVNWKYVNRTPEETENCVGFLPARRQNLSWRPESDNHVPGRKTPFKGKKFRFQPLIATFFLSPPQELVCDKRMPAPRRSGHP